MMPIISSSGSFQREKPGNDKGHWHIQEIFWGGGASRGKKRHVKL